MFNTALLHKLRSMSTWALRLASNHKTLFVSFRTQRAILRNAVAVAPPDDAFSPPTKSRQHAWRPPRATIPSINTERTWIEDYDMRKRHASRSVIAEERCAWNFTSRMRQRT